MDDDFFYESPNDNIYEEKEKEDVNTALDDTSPKEDEEEMNHEEDIDDEENVDDEDYDEDYYDEKNLPSSLKSDFKEIIRNRGEDYYYQGRVLKVFKNGNEYRSKVKGSDGDIYDVLITVDDETMASYECSCPYDDNCKHEYATLLAIAKAQYKEVELKENITEEVISVKKLIELIPAEEFKKYVLSKTYNENITLDIDMLAKEFNRYTPVQSYEYYYNNLYNKLVLEDDNILDYLDNYYEKIRTYLNSLNYQEVFIILKAIIEAYHDSNKMSLEENFFDLILKVGMFMRIIYRKPNGEVQKEIDEYATSLKNASFYNNDYLEDMILTLKG